ncbi:tetratricopeptide repeat protein [Aliidiomarina soli]|uniref:Uncharacterized protein n=1 Tax=Aliidiomarina soli TaxID=1928574 RepID=A0A432WIU5_9GAMM|nr:tetratricopeptide repeat protein [Aliidiomarina soli]RUO33752.1 hypothetical protein CWE14_04610 [Aliidiomarina soli]
MRWSYFHSCAVLIFSITLGSSTYASENDLPNYGVISAEFGVESGRHKSCDIFTDERNENIVEEGDVCPIQLKSPCRDEFYCHELVHFNTRLEERLIRLYSDKYAVSGDAQRLGINRDPGVNPLGRLHGFYIVDDNYYRAITGANMRQLSSGQYSIGFGAIQGSRFSQINFRYQNGFIYIDDFYERFPLSNSDEERQFKCVPEDGELQVSLDTLRFQDKLGNSFYDYVFKQLCGFEDSDYEKVEEDYKLLEPLHYLQKLSPEIEGYARMGLPVYNGGSLLYFTSYLAADQVEKLDSPFQYLSSNRSLIVCYENCEPYTEFTDRRSYPRELDAYFRDENRQAVLSSADVRAMLLVVPVSITNVQHYNNIAYYLEQSGQYNESILLLNAVVAVFPNRTVAYINLGDAHWGNENYDQAREAYQTYIRLMRENNREQRIPQRVLERIGD